MSKSYRTFFRCSCAVSESTLNRMGVIINQIIMGSDFSGGSLLFAFQTYRFNDMCKFRFPPLRVFLRAVMLFAFQIHVIDVPGSNLSR